MPQLQFVSILDQKCKERRKFDDGCLCAAAEVALVCQLNVAAKTTDDQVAAVCVGLGER